MRARVGALERELQAAREGLAQAEDAKRELAELKRELAQRDDEKSDAEAPRIERLQLQLQDARRELEGGKTQPAEASTRKRERHHSATIALPLVLGVVIVALTIVAMRTRESGEDLPIVVEPPSVRVEVPDPPELVWALPGATYVRDGVVTLSSNPDAATGSSCRVSLREREDFLIVCGGRAVYTHSIGRPFLCTEPEGPPSFCTLGGELNLTASFERDVVEITWPEDRVVEIRLSDEQP